MDCLELDRLLYPYLDGELLPAEKLSVEQHLGACSECSKSFEAERSTLAIIRSAALAATPPAPITLKKSLLDGIRGEQRKQRQRRYLQLSVAAAGVAICAVAVTHQWRVYQRKAFINDMTARFARGYPLEIQQQSPRAIEQWYLGKLNHRVFVPSFPNTVAAGARLLNVGDKQAALIRFDTQRPGEAAPRPLGLFVFENEEGQVAALPDVEFGSSNGFNVVSWRDGNVEYGLVTDLDENGIRQLLPEPARAGGMPTIDVVPVSLER